MFYIVKVVIAEHFSKAFSFVLAWLCMIA